MRKNKSYKQWEKYWMGSEQLKIDNISTKKERERQNGRERARERSRKRKTKKERGR